MAGAGSGHRHDVLVIGAGPAGAAAAYWLAEAGHDVVMVEKKTFPRDKTCGDGLTPRAVKQLQDMGLGHRLDDFHRHNGLRVVAHGITLELPWPDHPVYPSRGYVIRRCQLDQIVADHAVKSGAVLRQGVEGLRPLTRDGLVVGAEVHDKESGATEVVNARYMVIADGANSRFGRALGITRNRGYPQGMAIRTYYESPLHDEPWIESALDVRDRNGNSLPGYGWVFPVGNGTINVGIGLLSTFRDYKSINTTHLMNEWARSLPEHWQIDPDQPTAAPTGGRLPMAGSVNPKAGPTWVVVGDAAGSVNPFNGEGIDYAYETGRLAAELLDESIRAGDALRLSRYPTILDDEYRVYYQVASAFAEVIGRPRLMRELTRIGMRSETIMQWVLRIMANLMRDDALGPPEAIYKAAAGLVSLFPAPVE